MRSHEILYILRIRRTADLRAHFLLQQSFNCDVADAKAALVVAVLVAVSSWLAVEGTRRLDHPGLIGRAHIRVLQQSSTCTLSAVADPHTPAGEFGVPVYASLEELVEQDRPDGIVLATPNQLHLPQALACLEAGLPTLLEKPATTSVAEGEQLVRAVERTGGRLLVGHHRTHSPLLAQARRVIAEGALGRLVAVMGSAVFYNFGRGGLAFHRQGGTEKGWALSVRCVRD